MVRTNFFYEGDEKTVAATAGHTAAGSRFGFKPGQVVQELGYADDVDEDIREEIEDITGSELVDEYFEEVADAVILWWHGDDGDLTDALVDSLTALDGGGVVWLLTPKAGLDGHVEPHEVEEAATTAGLHATTTFMAGPDWSAMRLAQRGRGR